MNSHRLNSVLRLLGSALLLIWLALIFMIFMLHPAFADDYMFLADIRRYPAIQDYVHHIYVTFSGRVPQLVLSYLSLGSETSRLIYQTFAFVCLCGTAVLMSALSLGRLPQVFGRDKLITLLILAMLWFGNAAVGETVFYIAGSFTYLVPTFFMLLFVLPYTWALTEPDGLSRINFCNRFTCRLGLFLLGIIVGSFHEQIMLSVGLLSGFWLLAIQRKGYLAKVPTGLYTGLVGLAIGAVITLAAPGNYVRLRHDAGATPLLLQLIYSTTYFIRYILTPGLLAWAALILAIVFLSGREENRTRLPVSGAFVVAAFGSLIFPLLAHHYFSARTAYFAIIYLTLAMAFPLADVIQAQKVRLTVIQSGLLCVLISVALCGDALQSLYVTARVHKALQGREQEISAQVQQGVFDVRVRPLPSSSNGRLLFYFDELDTAGFGNLLSDLSYRYGVKSVVVDSTLPVWKEGSFILPTNLELWELNNSKN